MHRFTPHIIYQRSRVDIIAVVVFVIASLLQIIAVATPGWAQTPDVLVGLFHYCGKLTLDHRTSSMRTCDHVPNMSTIETLHVVQVLAVVTVVLTVLSTALFIIHVWMITQYEKITATVIIICLSLGIISVLCCVANSVLFAIKTRYAFPRVDNLTINDFQMYYSFGLYVAGGAILLLMEVVVVGRVRKLTRMLLV